MSKLQHEDIHPKFYQKMNVGQAFRVISLDHTIVFKSTIVFQSEYFLVFQ